MVASVSAASGRVLRVGPGGFYRTISDAVRQAGPGDVVSIAPGTYAEELWLTRSGTPGLPITLQGDTAGAVVLDGSHLPIVISSNHGTTTDIVLRNLTIRGCANPKPDQEAAVTTGANWRLEDVTVDAAQGTGLTVYSSNVTLLRVAANHCGRAGLCGSGCSFVTAKDCTTVGNNTAGNDPDFDAGAGKWMRTDHVTIDHLLSHDNTGPGLWFDYNNTHAVIRNCDIFNNRGLAHAYSGSGMRFELDPGPVLVEANHLHGNTGPNLEICSSRNFVVQGNDLTGSSLALKDWPRGEDYTLANVTLSHNRLRDCHLATESPNWDAASPALKHVSIDYDQYEWSTQDPLFQWGDAVFTHLNDVRRALGFERHGGYNRVREPVE